MQWIIHALQPDKETKNLDILLIGPTSMRLKKLFI